MKHTRRLVATSLKVWQNTFRHKNGPGEVAASRSPAHSHKEVTVDTNILRNTPEKVAAELRGLEERLRHERMDDEDRQELRDRVIALRRHLAR